MDIKQAFLELTSKTYPHGTEESVFPILFSYVDGLQRDEFGNLFIKIGQSDVMFTSHLDTATSVNTSVKHVFSDNLIKTDGKSILGADDKAGVTVMLYMIKNNVPGLYYFFLGEEVGCVGSKKVAEIQKKEKIEGINKVISFDRRGTNSVITFQSSKRCCSDNFGKSLSAQLNQAESSFLYETDPTGILTDSVQFVSIYPECTNISVGYQSEHTFSETQDIIHLEKLAKACLLVDWNSLPVERDPSSVEYKYYGRYGSYYDDDYCYDYGYMSNKVKRDFSFNKTKTDNIWFHDKKWNYVSKIEIDAYTKKVISVDLHPNRISDEKEIIDKLMRDLEIDFKTSNWNGFKYILTYNTGQVSECDRNELLEYLDELDYEKIEVWNGKKIDPYEYFSDAGDGFWD